MQYSFCTNNHKNVCKINGFQLFLLLLLDQLLTVKSEGVVEGRDTNTDLVRQM
jgi:hypothetical protein